MFVRVLNATSANVFLKILGDKYKEDHKDKDKENKKDSKLRGGPLVAKHVKSRDNLRPTIASIFILFLCIRYNIDPARSIDYSTTLIMIGTWVINLSQSLCRPSARVKIKVLRRLFNKLSEVFASRENISDDKLKSVFERVVVIPATKDVDAKSFKDELFAALDSVETAFMGAHNVIWC